MNNKACWLTQEYGFQMILTCLFEIYMTIHFTNVRKHINLESTYSRLGSLILLRL